VSDVDQPAPHTFTLAISNAGSVDAGALQVVLGTPAPQTVTLGAIEFFVTSISPLFDIPAGGAALTVTGSGFMAPFVVRINGVVCPGTAQISGGTQVTGLFVPPGSGTNLTIEISSGNLPTYTHTQTFDYFAVFTGGGGGGGKGGGGCTTGAPALPALLLATIPALLAIRRRKASRQ